MMNESALDTLKIIFLLGFTLHPIPFAENASIGKFGKCRFISRFYDCPGGAKAWLD